MTAKFQWPVGRGLPGGYILLADGNLRGLGTDKFAVRFAVGSHDGRVAGRLPLCKQLGWVTAVLDLLM